MKVDQDKIASHIDLGNFSSLSKLPFRYILLEV
jgi:hypothetical protein